MFAWFCIFMFKVCGVLAISWGWLIVLFLLNLIVEVILHALFSN